MRALRRELTVRWPRFGACSTDHGIDAPTRAGGGLSTPAAPPEPQTGEQPPKPGASPESEWPSRGPASSADLPARPVALDRTLDALSAGPSLPSGRSVLIAGRVTRSPSRGRPPDVVHRFAIRRSATSDERPSIGSTGPGCESLKRLVIRVGRARSASARSDTHGAVPRAGPGCRAARRYGCGSRSPPTPSTCWTMRADLRPDLPRRRVGRGPSPYDRIGRGRRHHPPPTRRGRRRRLVPWLASTPVRSACSQPVPRVHLVAGLVSPQRSDPPPPNAELAPDQARCGSPHGRRSGPDQSPSAGSGKTRVLTERTATPRRRPGHRPGGGVSLVAYNRAGQVGDERAAHRHRRPSTSGR